MARQSRSTDAAPHSSFSISPQTRSAGKSSSAIARHSSRVCSSSVKLEPRRELDGAEHAQAVVRESRRIDDAQQAAGDVAAAVERVFVRFGQRIPGNCVDGEVAPARGFLDRQRRIAADVEPAMATAGFRFAAGQRDVDVADLVDLEALADGFDAAERLEQAAQMRRHRRRRLRCRCPSRRAPSGDRAPSRRRSARDRRRRGRRSRFPGPCSGDRAQPDGRRAVPEPEHNIGPARRLRAGATRRGGCRRGVGEARSDGCLPVRKPLDAAR